MTNTLNQKNHNTTTVAGGYMKSHKLYGAVPPGATVGGVLPVGQVYTTNTTAGQFLTSGSNGTNWTNGTTPYDSIMVAKNNPPELEVKGRMVINGRDLEERLNTIEKVLQIPEKDVILERKHPKLKKLYDEYIAALGKYRTFESIKGEE